MLEAPPPTRNNDQLQRKSLLITSNIIERHSQVKRLQTEDFDILKKIKSNNDLSPFRKWLMLLKNVQNNVYILIEDPTSSSGAMLAQYLLLMCILTSCGDIIADSVVAAEDTNYRNSSGYIEVILFVVFFTEYILRLLSCTAFDNRLWDFIRSPMNLIDLVAILPFILEVAIQSARFKQLRIIRAIRFLRIFRVFKASRYLRGMNLLADTIRHSFTDILMLTCVLIMLVLAFSTIVFYSEIGYDYDDQGDDERAIKTMLDAIWWCITTMTTVGYGDKLPFTIMGRIVTCVAATLGITCISLPVAILGINFSKCMRDESESMQIDALKGLNLDSRSRHPGNVQASKDDEDLQELLFMEKRLQNIFENNQRLLQLTKDSQALVDDVTDQLKILYSVLSHHMDMHLDLKLKASKVKVKVMMVEKNIKEKKQLNMKSIISKLKEKHLEADAKKQQSETDSLRLQLRSQNHLSFSKLINSKGIPSLTNLNAQLGNSSLGRRQHQSILLPQHEHVEEQNESVSASESSSPQVVSPYEEAEHDELVDLRIKSHLQQLDDNRNQYKTKQHIDIATSGPERPPRWVQDVYDFAVVSQPNSVPFTQ